MRPIPSKRHRLEYAVNNDENVNESGGPTREERSVEGGDMGSTRVVGDVEGAGVVTIGGEGGVGGIEYSDADREEERVRKFCTEGCGCALNSTPCSTQFTIEHFREMRGNAAELSWSEQNMSVMSQIMAFTFCDATPLNSSKHHHKQKTRERSSTSFHHHGLRVCRKTLFLHKIGKARLQDLRSHYLSNGLVPRLHGHRSCSSKRFKYGSCSEHYCICNALC